METRRRHHINHAIVQKLERALEAAELKHCAIAEQHRRAMKNYLDTWVVAPLQAALDEIKGE